MLVIDILLNATHIERNLNLVRHNKHSNHPEIQTELLFEE